MSIRFFRRFSYSLLMSSRYPDAANVRVRTASDEMADASAGLASGFVLPPLPNDVSSMVSQYRCDQERVILQNQ